MFKSGRTSLDDDPRCGRPSTAINQETVKAVEKCILADRRVTIVEVERETGLSHGSIQSIIHDHLGMNKVSSRWVPKFLNSDLKQKRIEISKENLELMEHDFEKFKDRLVAGDETWIYHYDPESKRQSMEWHRRRSSRSYAKTQFQILYKTQPFFLNSDDSRQSYKGAKVAPLGPSGKPPSDDCACVTSPWRQRTYISSCFGGRGQSLAGQRQRRTLQGRSVTRVFNVSAFLTRISCYFRF